MFAVMKHLLFTLLVTISLHTYAQRNTVEIPLPASISSKNMEYSSLAFCGSRIILTPQYPARYIYALDTAYMDAAIQGTPTNDTLYELEFKNLYPLIAKIKGYEGMEACVVVGDRIFYTIETSEYNDYCYLVRGAITGKKIMMDTSHLFPLPKLHKNVTGIVNEAGYESLAYLPAKDKLLAIFEYNHLPGHSRGLLVDTSLENSSTIDLQPIDFRITDIHQRNGQLYGINYSYHGDYKAFEPDERIKKPDGADANWRKDCFARLVKFDVGEKEIKITPMAPFTWECDNWEGILIYKKGVLMITDQHPRTKLVYMPF